MAPNTSLQPTHSCLYRGRVRHRRRGPQPHEFQYSLFLVYLDLDELPEVLDRYWLWSARLPNLARFRREDHLGDPQQSLKDSVAELVEERLGWRPAGPVRLLTHLRYFGYIQNPVSFYYCYDSDGKHVEAVVAEVNNTPWGERHCYVLDHPMQPGGSARRGIRVSKEFHVSPFMDLDMEYRWHLREPGEHLSLHIDNLREERVVFDVTMNLQRHPLNSLQLAACLMRFPFMTGQVVAAIYWQALRLWWKRTPFVPHPRQRGLVPQARKTSG